MPLCAPLLPAQHAPQSRKGSCKHPSVICMLPQRFRPAHLHFAKAQNVTVIGHEAVAKAGQQGCSPRGIHPIATPDVSGAEDSAFAPHLHLTCTQTGYQSKQDATRYNGATISTEAHFVRLCIVRSCSLVKWRTAATILLSNLCWNSLGSAWHALSTMAELMIRLAAMV